MGILITGASPKKTLAIQFKYLGDAVFLTPALRALREHEPQAELHVLLAEDVAPLLENLPWITRVWSLPRTRGQARLRDSWPVIRALRREHFDRAVDFGGNDRGAILSWLSGARQRLGHVDNNGLIKKLAYTQAVPTKTLPTPYAQNHVSLLAAWGVPPPKSNELEIAADPTLAREAANLLPDNMIICHLGTSQPRKEWPLERWRDFYRLAGEAGWQLAFSAGNNDRERALLARMKLLEPECFLIPTLPKLKLFLAVLRRARALVAGDTGPLHFAAALGVPVVGLFGKDDSLERAAPNYEEMNVIRSTDFPVEDNGMAATNGAEQSWVAAIPAEPVRARLAAVLGRSR